MHVMSMDSSRIHQSWGSKSAAGCYSRMLGHSTQSPLSTVQLPWWSAPASAVVFDGSDLLGVDETVPYTRKPMDYYTETKVAGEKLILAANSPSLAVVALRPSGIYGEGDTVMVPTLVRQARAGKMKYIIGNGKNVWDFTYVGNVAQAHVLVSTAGSAAAGMEYCCV